MAQMLTCQFMMDFKLKMEKPDPSKAWISAGVMGASYFLGGIIPMIPYFIAKERLHRAQDVSISIAVVVLVVFGYIKSLITGTGHKSAVISAIQTLVVGALAVGASYGIVRGVNAALGGAVAPMGAAPMGTAQMGADRTDAMRTGVLLASSVGG